jgi:hypothetical protein
MSSRRAFIPIRSLLLFAMPLFIACSTALPTTAQATGDTCDALPKVSVPEADQPTLQEATAVNIPLREPSPSGGPGILPVTTYCDAIGLYYGISPQHFQRARYCVLAKLGFIRGNASPAVIKQAQSAAFGGATLPEDIDGMEGLVLSMVYGNGEGVARNLPLAEQYFCQNAGGIQGEDPAKLLVGFTQAIQANQHFDVCDQYGAPFGRSVNYGCLYIRQEKQNEEIRHREAAILATAIPPVKASFLALRAAWQSLHEAYGPMFESACGGGTGCGVMGEADDLGFTAGWNADLVSIQQGKPPSFGVDPSTLARVDHELNTKYRGSMQEANCDPEALTKCLTTTTRDADRAWLKYREAWVRFGASRWPQIPADQWRAWQTEQWMPLLSTN